MEQKGGRGMWGCGRAWGKLRSSHLSSKETICSMEVISCLLGRGKKHKKLCSNTTVIKSHRLCEENVQSKEKETRDRKIIHSLSTQRHLLLLTFQGVSFQIKNVIFRDVKCCQSTESRDHRGHWGGKEQSVVFPSRCHIP